MIPGRYLFLYNGGKIIFYTRVHGKYQTKAFLLFVCYWALVRNKIYKKWRYLGDGRIISPPKKWRKQYSWLERINLETFWVLRTIGKNLSWKKAFFRDKSNPPKRGAERKMFPNEMIHLDLQEILLQRSESSKIEKLLKPRHFSACEHSFYFQNIPCESRRIILFRNKISLCPILYSRALLLASKAYPNQCVGSVQGPSLLKIKKYISRAN